MIIMRRKEGFEVAIKQVCERCGDVTNGHKVYLGRYIAIDKLWTSNASSTWGTKKIDVCYECYREFERWMDNEANISQKS